MHFLDCSHENENNYIGQRERESERERERERKSFIRRKRTSYSRVI